MSRFSQGPTGHLAGLGSYTNRERETEGGSVAERAAAVATAAGSCLHLWSGLGSLLGVGAQSAVYTEGDQSEIGVSAEYKGNPLRGLGWGFVI